MSHRIIILGDTHFPFHSKLALKQVYNILRQFSLDKKIKHTVIQIGDLYDLFSFGKYPRSLDHITPKQEVTSARAEAEAFWQKIKNILPNAECYQMLGNHDSRKSKRVLECLPEIYHLASSKELWRFQGVHTMDSERDELIIDNICYQHGFRTKLGDHAKHNLISTVCGHSHVGGVIFFRYKEKILFELNAGFLADDTSFALSYTQQRRLSKWTLGLGIIDHLGPRFSPIENPKDTRKKFL